MGLSVRKQLYPSRGEKLPKKRESNSNGVCATSGCNNTLLMLKILQVTVQHNPPLYQIHNDVGYNTNQKTKMTDIEMTQEKILKLVNQERNEQILVYPNDLEYDIFHSVMLSHYINYWGRPSFKKSISKNRNIPISVYCFENSINNKDVVYFSTIGVSFQKKIIMLFKNKSFLLFYPR
ncbi:hypothetical protein, partial [Ursidibacter arcticus]